MVQRERHEGAPRKPAGKVESELRTPLRLQEAEGSLASRRPCPAPAKTRGPSVRLGAKVAFGRKFVGPAKEMFWTRHALVSKQRTSSKKGCSLGLPFEALPKKAPKQEPPRELPARVSLYCRWG